MKIPAHLHNRLVEAGQHAISCRAGNGRASRKHNTALAELDEVIWQIMSAVPGAFSEQAWRELDERRRKDIA
jgi:hypothetical protein